MAQHHPQLQAAVSVNESVQNKWVLKSNEQKLNSIKINEFYWAWLKEQIFVLHKQRINKCMLYLPHVNDKDTIVIKINFADGKNNYD